MTTGGKTLGARTDMAFRTILASQADAYRSYGDLLGLLSGKKIKTLDFVRKSFDLYVDATGKVLSGAGDIGRDTLKTGVEKASTVARKAEVKISEIAEPVLAQATPEPKTSKTKTTRVKEATPTP